ncbi:TPA: hypothetical protein R9C30_002436 [Staphylococcus aureus]|uniref:hypothetical protein n=1 Tax=Staphylococcus aureus TaxID=1280 RepID=UPI000912A247|nr:hypothetical protein [Staphylococcus aureus]MDU2082258.1 hypothetical protein [Staphylococcus epidermidis]MDU2137808.1 hypothetical protein [Staphylococcus warneri]MDU4503799.1 hypothetical protein [Staphylococcus warneri]MDU5112766.1 hypothetical protein [Staphylococcus epidermidis]SGT91140.1 Uncharacterised protein [Staphylococcus aureus]
MLDLMTSIASIDFSSFTLGQAGGDLVNNAREGERNFTLVLNIVYWAIAAITIVVLALSKKFRMALGALIILGVIGALVVRDPQNLQNLGESIAQFFGF